MHIVNIPKKTKGEYRTIGVPNWAEKNKLRQLVEQINIIQQNVCNKNIVFGFMPQKNIVLNARKHIGYKYTLNLDLKDFFDTVTPDHVREYLVPEIIKEVFIQGRAWQGLPTSPAVANLAAAKMDNDILVYINNISNNIVYTRYADDLSFSFNDYDTYKTLIEDLPKMIEFRGFKLNIKKIRLQDARFGLREVTAIKVGNDKIYVPRRLKRRMRAAKHKNNNTQLHGLREFCKLKSPHQPAMEQLNNIRNHLRALIIQSEFQEKLKTKSNIKNANTISAMDFMDYKQALESIITKINSIDNKYLAKKFIKEFLYSKNAKYKEELAYVSNLLKEKSETI